MHGLPGSRDVIEALARVSGGECFVECFVEGYLVPRAVEEVAAGERGIVLDAAVP
jgi:hypothetical protein